MSALLLMLPLYASLIRFTGCLKFDSVVLIVAELVAVVAICVAEVLPRHLQGDASSRDTSLQVGVGAGEVVGVDLRHYPPNACKIAVLPLNVGLVGSVVLWWKALLDDVLVSVVPGALPGGDETEAVAVPVPFVEKIIGALIRQRLYHFHFTVCRSQGLARAVVELLT